MIQKVQSLKQTNLSVYNKIANTFNKKTFPCIYGKLSFNKNMMYVNIYEDLESNSIKKLSDDLREMSQQLDSKRTDEEMRFNTFISVFTIDDSQISFDKIWYKIITQLNKFDVREWQNDSPKDLNHPDFKFSFHDKLWYPVLVTPNHPIKIRQSEITILSFQPDMTFILNKKIDNQYYGKVRTKIHKKIDKIYDNKRPHYLSSNSTGKGMVQYLGYDFEEDKKFQYPNLFMV